MNKINIEKSNLDLDTKIKKEINKFKSINDLIRNANLYCCLIKCDMCGKDIFINVNGDMEGGRFYCIKCIKKNLK